MIKFTNAQLKQMAKLDWIIDLNNQNAVNEHLDEVGYACDLYGICGKMWRGRESDNIYVAHSRSQAVWRF